MWSEGLQPKASLRLGMHTPMKKLMGEYHKVFIDRVLADGCLPLKNEGHNNSLTEYYDNYVSKSQNEDAKKAFEENQQNLRSVIAQKFTEDKAYANLFCKNLIESYKDKTDKTKIIDSDLFNFINTAESTQLYSIS